eukprot:g42264.t1
MYHPHILAADVLTFLARYVQLEGGSSDVVDPFGSWISQRQVKVTLKADTSGSILHLLFKCGVTESVPNLREVRARGIIDADRQSGRADATSRFLMETVKVTNLHDIFSIFADRGQCRYIQLLPDSGMVGDSQVDIRRFFILKGVQKARERWGKLYKLQKTMQNLLLLQMMGVDVTEALPEVKSQQSYPLSPALFTEAIRKDVSLRGVTILVSRGLQVKASLYMDDLIVFCLDSLSVRRHMSICNESKLTLGAKVNRGKSKAMFFGNCTDRSFIPFIVRTNYLKVLGIWFGGARTCTKCSEDSITK